jgi:spermidine synthase
MLPWTRLGLTVLPCGSELSLWRRGNELVVRAGSSDLMSTRSHASEELLAELGCRDLGDQASIFLGGLGFGYTLRAALRLSAPATKITVAELVPAMADWARGPVGGGGYLEDPRVVLIIADAAVLLRRAHSSFDAILLDVDNGPAPLTQASNAWLYSGEGLKACARALRDGGRLLVWSAADDVSFGKRMARAGFEVRTVRAPSRRDGAKRKGATHAIFVGCRRREWEEQGEGRRSGNR